MKEELHRIESLGARGDVRELAGWLAHEDWQLRRAAVDAIVAHALAAETAESEAAVEELVRSLYSEENAGLRSAAQEALTRLAPEVVGRLLGEIGRAPTDVRILLAPVLGESGSARAVPALLDLARSEDVNVATAAIIGLGRLRRREAVGPLLGILASGNPWLAFPTVEALGVLGDASAVEPLAARLDDQLLGLSALDALARIGGPQAARALAMRLFASGPLRADALAALVRLTEESWPPELAAVVRLSAVAAFRKGYRPERFDELAELAKADSPHSEAVLEALGWSGDARALPVLLVALGRPASQASAAAGLATLVEDPAVVGELRQYAEHLAAPTRLELARILAAPAPVEAAFLLAGLMEEDDDLGLDAVEAAADVADRFDEVVVPDAAGDAIDRLLETIERVGSEARGVIARLVRRLAAVPGVDRERLTATAVALLEAEDVGLRLAGVEMLAGWEEPDERWYDALEAGLGDADPAVRLRAVEAAAAADLETADLFIAGLADKDPLVRRAAVAALARFDTEESSQALHAAVDDWHGVVAADALAAVAARGGAEAEPVLLAASRSERALLRCVAAERLAALESEAARARALEMAAADGEFEVRRAAVAALAARPGVPEARRAIDPALADAHRAVRRAGLRLAAAVADPALADRVAAIADGDEAEDVRGEAIVALAALAPDAALERVGRAILDQGVAPYAVRALARVAAAGPERLRQYRERSAPPRAAFAIDALEAGKLR